MTAASDLLEACLPLRRRSYATTAEAYRQAYTDVATTLPLFPPPMRHIDRPLPPHSATAPFLCTSGGRLARGTPDDVDELLAGYLVSGVSPAAPNIDVGGETVEVSSNGQARRALAAASAEGKSYWAACRAPVEHPSWWPVRAGAKAVPGFEHLICGEGASGIGMHRDRYREAEQPDRLVSTYLSLSRGRKHVLLLPPTDEGAAVAQQLGGEGCDDASGRASSQRACFPLLPSPDLLERVLAAGGFWFDLEAPTSAGGEALEGEEESEEEGEEEGGEEEGDEEESDQVLCLFMPAGWWHWLVADSEWHVAWSGSFFPTQGRAAGGGGERARHPARRSRAVARNSEGAVRRELDALSVNDRGRPPKRAPRWSRGF